MTTEVVRDSRGFVVPSLLNVLLILGAATALISAVWGAVAWHASTHYKRGAADKTVEWEAANRKADDLERARRNAVSAALLLEQQARQAADVRAADSDRKWKEARRANRTATLATCTPVAAPAPVAGEPVGGVRLTAEFLRLYNAAWTGTSGEPVFPAAGGGASAGKPSGAEGGKPR